MPWESSKTYLVSRHHEDQVMVGVWKEFRLATFVAFMRYVSPGQGRGSGQVSVKHTSGCGSVRADTASVARALFYFVRCRVRKKAGALWPKSQGTAQMRAS